jgi:hypothetical protein
MGKYSKLSKLWQNRKLIMEGITNTVLRDAFVEKVAEERGKVCNSCPRKDNEGSSCMVSGTQPCCNLCGCSLTFKLRSLSAECPDFKWLSHISEEDEDKLNSIE